MTIVRVSWVAEMRSGIPATTPPLDTWKVQVLDSTGAAVAMLTQSNLEIRELDLNVPNDSGTGFIAKVGIVSADGTVTGPEISSAPFDITQQLVPVTVTTSLPT